MEPSEFERLPFKEKMRLGRVVNAKDRGETLSGRDSYLCHLYGEEARKHAAFWRNIYWILFFSTLNGLMVVIYIVFF